MKKVERKKNTKSVSMKDALEGINVSERKVVDSDEQKFDFRDFLWNYPFFMFKVFKKFIPLSYVLVFGLFGVLVSFFLDSKVVARMLESSGTSANYTEGSVGAISSFNPLFMSVNYVDKAVQELVFERFVYIDEAGEPLEGIATQWSVSEDRLEYFFEIGGSQYWHDGSKITADDVVFTFNTARILVEDYGFDSVGSSLIGVEVSKVDQDTVVFKLDEQNPTFFEAISLFVVPASRFEGEDLSQIAFNMFARYPVGSGKYKVTRTEQNVVYLSDNPYDEVQPNIKNLVFKVFPDRESMEMSFRIGVLDAIGGWDKELLDFSKEYPNLVKYTKVEEYRTKLLFFNLRNDQFKTKEGRLAINYLIDKDKLVEELASGAVVRKGPFYEESWVFNPNVDYYSYDPTKASELLTGFGYTKGESGYFENEDGDIYSFTLSYFDSPTNDRLVDILVEMFKEEGVLLKADKLNYKQITQEIIATRNFDVLLYEVETTVDPDQYNLWHSLKSNHPDLNISGYSYERVDILLEDARKTSDRKVRKEKYDLFQRYLMADAPVVFLFNPTYNYLVKDHITGIDMSDINYSYERFNNIEDWSIQ